MAREVERGDNECGTDTRLKAATDVKMDKKPDYHHGVHVSSLLLFSFSLRTAHL
ncbi:MAG: hypothetical protein JJE19_01160 [Methanosarcinales archaeon]|nr:hypothetical protein [Methanosarcinales archaeon]